MGPGREVYSLFGHTALRIRDPRTGTDRIYNYGTFDFRQPYFVARFARGLLDYQLSVQRLDLMLAEYRREERAVFEQHLALPPATVQRLFEQLETNYLPVNRSYRYDFLFDNCSTRPRDAVERALGHRLDYGAYRPPGLAFRDLLQPYLEADPLLDLGIDLALGMPVDRAASPREAMFLPVELMQAFDAASLDGHPLVARTDTLVAAPAPLLPRPAPDWPTVLAWLGLAAGLVLTLWPRPRLRLRFDRLLLGAVGLAGLVVLLLWVATEHRTTGPNLNVLWAWPTHLAAAFFAGRDARWARAYFGAAAAVTFLTLVAAPVLPQALHPAVFPLGLLLVLRCADRALLRRQAPTLAEA